ncbi:hypothetical protein J4E93_002100 [Alternaria ventricosa]|uniref:uncharacterized protein n=1 Tax=Alternaria ventricosa TaxID=1187951 RepID=UPI0020C31182|nr:uncharacterized protein J4E93_002100 [Alternaria ventricosa]KAI4651904.1 hypothetical protein J4E93_002100 [Alternaria ventricosa]
MVTPAPRRSVVLPNEVLKMILMNILIFSTVSPQGKPMNASRFAWLHKCLLHKLCLVSGQFQAVALEVFYENNHFEFISKTSRRTPLMPPIHVFHSLRHIRVQLVLTDGYAGEPIVLPDGILDTKIYFRNTTDLFKHCPGAHTLRKLSDLSTMQNLRTIQLHIVPIFTNPDLEAAIAIYHQARFKIGARDECKITVEAGLSDLKTALLLSGLCADS